MDPMKNGCDDFVTVVAVGNQSKIENFVTVLSIGAAKNDLSCLSNGFDTNLEEEVEVFRLPGERLGFGLKFEGGNKTSERVKRLFVQSCAEESPASRAKCSWGGLGEGDEILSIDGVPVMHMTRLDCVRRLKESQLVIKLLVRCRGALKPEVVSAERKSTPEKCKIPPELPAAPPPVPPRKLRHARGLADGEANPSPAKKIHKNGSPNIHQSNNVRATTSNKCMIYDSSNSSPKTPISRSESLKKLSKECSPELTKPKQEPPEAMVYLDARSQDGSSTHGSTSDDTGSSMSTVVDRFSTSDRISTTSTTSTTSEFPFDWSKERSDEQFEFEKTRPSETPMKGILESFAQFDRDFSINPSDYLLKRLANSEAVTHVESRGEAGAVVEKVTAVIAPNTVVIEETMTLQPPLSFQDAPLSYGHEARPGIFYTADLAADSTTHFRPIRDDVSIVECINGDSEYITDSEIDLNKTNGPKVFSNVAPPLPTRNHVNCIPVNQILPSEILPVVDLNVLSKNISFVDTKQSISIPPKPLPRKDAKLKRKQLPPPPPPPNTTPRRELPPPVPVRNLEISASTIKPSDDFTMDVNVVAISTSLLQESKESNEIGLSSVSLRKNESIESSSSESFDHDQKQMDGTIVNESQINDEQNNSDSDEIIKKIVEKQEEQLPIMETNKVFEIIEMRKVKALHESSRNKKNGNVNQSESGVIPLMNKITDEVQSKENELNTPIIIPAPRENKQSPEKKINDVMSEENIIAVTLNKCFDEIDSHEEQLEPSDTDISVEEEDEVCKTSDISEEDEVDHVDTEETYQSTDSMNEINDSISNNDINEEDQQQDECDSSSDSDCDRNEYYWQSNLATIGEEEETPSLEYITINNQVNEIDSRPDDVVKQSHAPVVSETNGFNMNVQNETPELVKRITTNSKPTTTDKKADKNLVNGRMDNCGGGQRLPPDGDEFPAAYQEFSASSQQQYQSLGAPRTTTTLIFNGENEMYNGKYTNGNLQTEETRVTTQYIIANSKEMTATEIVDDKNLHTQDIARCNTTTHSTNIYSSLNNKSNNVPTMVLTEQSIEIAGYYPKESRMEIGGCGKDYPDSPPPPLPLTGPPKMEKPVPFTRSTSTDNSSRKFSLNSDSRRQDDKSEKSVRDKIAMFSSQSNLEAPLFPISPITTIVTNTGRRLSKHKSTEDFLNEEKDQSHYDKTTSLTERTFSSSNLLDSDKTNDATLVVEKYSEILPSLPRSSPPQEPLSFSSSSFTLNNLTSPKLQSSSSTVSLTDIKTIVNSTKPPVPMSNPPQDEIKKVIDEPTIIVRSSMPTLTRATSFSGGISFNGDPVSNNNNQISRTNSLASTFRRNSEDIRRTSLNQLIEQRKKGISKLRGLVIPEKDAVSIDQPIIDLPEIKSRDSILLHQMSKTNIQDKWGSQSSLASNASTQSVPIKTVTSFKMPPPQILPKYSPAFKRKSLAVYGSSNSNTMSNNISAPVTQLTSQMSASTPNEAPKSLESICSPTRSDYSFEFLSSSASPENLRNRQRINQRKIRGDYDDSDNDSAVSSSQSSISRGFSPPTSPVPSERSNLSSERSYPTSLIMEIPARNYLVNDRPLFNSKSVSYPSERTYQHSSNTSSSDSGSNSNSRSPTLESNSRYSSAIPQRELLKRSSSTETNYSTSSTLTSGSQASAESLSRRVLKPQSVEAINRKNILASARCRSGKNLNGSPLIQRKFSDDKVLPVSTLSHENGNCTSSSRVVNNNDISSNGEIKVAYVEMIDNFTDVENIQEKIDEPKLPPKKISSPVVNLPPKPDVIIQPSNDLKMWVRSEAKALLIRNSIEQSTEKIPDESNTHDQYKTPQLKSLSSLSESKIKPQSYNGSSDIDNIKSIDAQNDDLMATLTTRSRSRAPINLNDSSILRSRNHMSLEDILTGKVTPQTMRSDSQLMTSASHGRLSLDDKIPTKINSKESLIEKTFVSKIPTYGRQKINDNLDDTSSINERSKASKIPMQKSLGRRSASVTDMKRALDKPDYTTGNLNSHSIQSTHHRFSSLDSSVGNHNRTIGSEIEIERLYSENFGSISSLASSTSLISQQELAQLVEEASLDDPKGTHDLIVVLLHKENPSGSVGITLAGGIDCETKEISVHRVLAHSIADKDGRVHRGDRILSINGRSTRGLSHRESLAILKQPRSEIVLVISRAKIEEGNKMRSRTDSVETIVEGFEVNGTENTAWGPQIQVTILKDGAGLGFSLEGGRDSPFGDKPLIVKKIFTGGAAEKTGILTAGDQLLEVNGMDVTRMSRIEAWSLMKKLHDGDVNLLVRHPATKSS